MVSFCKGIIDVKYYEKIYLILGKYLDPEVSLNFISSGNTRYNHTGNCKQVIKITETLRASGNNLIWGIIDYDNKNQSNKYVKVIGENERYSIENFILDPLLISALLIREKIINKSEFGLNDNQTFFSLKSFSNEKLQGIIDYFISKLNDKSRISNDKSHKRVEIVNGFHLDIPVWYLTLQGHQLEEEILNIYPNLNSIKKGKEDKLKLAIIEKVMDDIPEIIPVSFLNLFTDIQK